MFYKKIRKNLFTSMSLVLLILYEDCHASLLAGGTHSFIIVGRRQPLQEFLDSIPSFVLSKRHSIGYTVASFQHFHFLTMPH